MLVLWEILLGGVLRVSCLCAAVRDDVRMHVQNNRLDFDGFPIKQLSGNMECTCSARALTAVSFSCTYLHTYTFITQLSHRLKIHL